MLVNAIIDVTTAQGFPASLPSLRATLLVVTVVRITFLLDVLHVNCLLLTFLQAAAAAEPQRL